MEKILKAEADKVEAERVRILKEAEAKALAYIDKMIKGEKKAVKPPKQKTTITTIDEAW